MTLQSSGLPQRGVACPPALALEALFAGEPSTPAVKSHAQTCPECRSYLTGLGQEQDAFLARRTPELFLRKVKRAETDPPRQRAWFSFLGAVAAAACALLLTVRGPEARLKGGGLSVFVKHGESSPRRLVAESRVHPGDQLRFAYASPQPGFVAVFELDGAGHVSVFHPFGGAAPAVIAPSNEDVLPGTVALDRTTGAEWLVAVFRPAPFDLSEIAAQLAATAAGETPAPSCDGCRVSALRLLKEP